MKIKLTNGRSAEPMDIEKLQREVGSKLPPSLVEFLHHHDGAKPETNSFKIGDTNESGVNRFIPLSDILSERRNLETLPTTAFPIAWAEGGNYVFIDMAAEGAVFFWDHEQPEPPTLLASDFASFLNMLEPFDPASIKLRPGQVKRAWIDPDFLKSLGQ
jgi:hypothetical protein